LLSDVGFEVHDKPPGAQHAAVFFKADHAATGCDQYATPGAEFIQQAAFALPETSLALDIEDQADTGACQALEFMVAVKKSQPEQPCQLFTDRSLARPHGPDQENILLAVSHPLVPPLIYGVQGSSALGNIAKSFTNGWMTGLMLRFFIIFSILLIGLFTLEILQPAEKYVIIPFTSLIADISVWLVKVFDENVIAMGNVIRDKATGFGVRIERGCNGLEAVIILFSAIFAFPAPFKNKLIGFVIGFFAIQLLNLVRIISLFYLGQWNYTAFEWFHLYLWQALIILDALVVWLIWLRTLPGARPPGGDGPQPEAS